MALIRVTQRVAVCLTFCNVPLGLPIHAKLNVADGTLSVASNYNRISCVIVVLMHYYFSKMLRQLYNMKFKVGNQNPIRIL